MTPIVLMSFNRPNYLEQVLRSLKEQKSVSVDPAQIYFFQDGAVNEYSGQRYAEDAVIEECVSLFKSFFPSGVTKVSASNLGVALNFERAESFVFDELGSDVAYFFEDDLLLGPYYLKVLDELRALVAKRDDVGYFAAYGNQYADAAEQMSAAHRLQPMSHNWAFGLTRKQWLSSKPYIESYLNLVRGIDYRKRDERAIASLMYSWGVKCPGSSQDVAKSLACYLSGGSKLRTYTAYGKYIGEYGLHSTPSSFEKMGFRNAVYIDEFVFKVSSIRDQDVAHARDRQRHYAFEEVIMPREP